MSRPMTFEEIGAALRVSPQRARQIFERAMKKLKAACKSGDPPTWGPPPGVASA